MSDFNIIPGNDYNEESYREEVLKRSGLIVESSGEFYSEDNIDTIEQPFYESLKFAWEECLDYDSTFCSDNMKSWEPTSFEITALLIHCYILFSNPGVELNGFLEDDTIPSLPYQKLNSKCGKWFDESGQISFRYRIMKKDKIDHLYVRFHKQTSKLVQMYMLSQLQDDVLEIVDIELNENIEDFKNLSGFYQKVSNKIFNSLSKFLKNEENYECQKCKIFNQGPWNTHYRPWDNYYDY